MVKFVWEKEGPIPYHIHRHFHAMKKMFLSSLYSVLLECPLCNVGHGGWKASYPYHWVEIWGWDMMIYIMSPNLISFSPHENKFGHVDQKKIIYVNLQLPYIFLYYVLNYCHNFNSGYLTQYYCGWYRSNFRYRSSNI